MESGKCSQLSIDCEDVATWSYVALSKIPG